MKIRQYINYTMLLCLLAWSTQFMTGCSKSDYMDDFKAENATGTSSDEPPSDEVSKALSAVHITYSILAQLAHKSQLFCNYSAP